MLLKKLRKPGQKIWFSKNCDISCFSNKFILSPNLNTIEGAGLMYGTSAYLFLRGNLLENLTFQVIGNARAANMTYNKFSEFATDVYEEPYDFYGNNLWNCGQSKLIAEKGHESANAYFHWQPV